MFDYTLYVTCHKDVKQEYAGFFITDQRDMNTGKPFLLVVFAEPKQVERFLAKRAFWLKALKENVSRVRGTWAQTYAQGW